MGAGRVGIAVARLLAAAGNRVIAVSGGLRSRERAERMLPGTPFLEPDEAAAAANVVVLSVPDDVVGNLASALPWRRGRWAVHVSGALGLNALEPARAAGAGVLSIHPLQSFPDVESAAERFRGVPIAVTADSTDGWALGEQLATDLGGVPFRLPEDRKPLYHAAAVFCANYLAVVEGAAARLFREAGVGDALATMAPLARSTLESVLELGPEVALTGPAVRGDAGTVRRNLEALEAGAPDLVPAYLALADAALDMAEAAGRLEHDGRDRVEEVLAGWR